MNCIYCNKELTTIKGLRSHLTRMHADISPLDKELHVLSHLYSTEDLKTIVNNYKNCLISFYEVPYSVQNYIKLLGLKRSSKEERKTDRYKQKYLNSIQEKYGDNISNISQNAEIKEKKNRTARKHFGSAEAYYKKCVDMMNVGYMKYKGTEKHHATLQKQRDTCFRKYGYENFGRGAAAISKARQSKKELIESWSYEERLARTERARAAVTHRGGFCSAPEKRVQKALIDLGITNILFNTMKWKYSWDAIFDNYIVEVQGIMWHAKPSMYNPSDLIMGKILASDVWKKDKIKKDIAILHGYTVIEIWEDEIKSYRTDIELLQMVQQKLKDNGYAFD